ncbi:hypothetical protein ABT336_14485 [Micromonospora sp. NPDC000207]|uniref:hypothetical protein n=1 Tax=Micromonospora sp. NPDC000207 TaxID=3154246 RepID=UPI00332BE17B
MTAVVFTPAAPALNIHAAKDALYRSDNGIKARPGDAALIADYDRFLGAQEYTFWASVDADEYAMWLAEQCRYCGPKGASGPDCGDCPEGAEVAA